MICTEIRAETRINTKVLHFVIIRDEAERKGIRSLFRKDLIRAETRTNTKEFIPCHGL